MRNLKSKNIEKYAPGLELEEKDTLFGIKGQDTWKRETDRPPLYIKWVQNSLNRVLRLRLPEDGIVGPKTRSAIRQFQKQQGLPIDGIVGPQTDRAIRRVLNNTLRGDVPNPDPAPWRPPPERFSPHPVENPGGGRIRDKTPLKTADMVTIRGVGGKNIQLHRFTAQAWKAMVRSARADGIQDPLLLPVSGYRSPEKQKRLWQRALKNYGSAREARKWVAPPGSSAHQTGRAIDLYLGDKNSSNNLKALRNLPAFNWLIANAEQFGFYPYPREPWHWEYNPPAIEGQELHPKILQGYDLRDRFQDEYVDPFWGQ